MYYTSRVDEDATGRKTLICWYNPELRNWDRVIKDALNRHKLDANVQILCRPRRKIWREKILNG